MIEAFSRVPLQACCAFAYITIPCIDSATTRVHLSAASAQIAFACRCYGQGEDGVLTVRNTCTRDGALSVIDGTATVVGPGRLKVRLDGVPFAADYWVLWVDEGYRTAVVGVPSGRAGWILNRDPEIPPDRLKAARDVLEFNGYDLSRLEMAKPGEGS